jgi:hypothetical protein
MTVIIGGINIDITLILFTVVIAAVVAGFVYRACKAAKKSGRKGAMDETKKYVGKALMRFDPITGAPINVVDKAAVVEYVEEHFQEGQNDETGIYGKEKDDF